MLPKQPPCAGGPRRALGFHQSDCERQTGRWVAGAAQKLCRVRSKVAEMARGLPRQPQLQRLAAAMTSTASRGSAWLRSLPLSQLSWELQNKSYAGANGW